MKVLFYVDIHLNRKFFFQHLCCKYLLAEWIQLHYSTLPRDFGCLHILSGVKNKPGKSVCLSVNIFILYFGSISDIVGWKVFKTSRVMTRHYKFHQWSLSEIRLICPSMLLDNLLEVFNPSLTICPEQFPCEYA